MCKVSRKISRSMIVVEVVELVEVAVGEVST